MENIRIGIIGHGFMGHEHEKMLTQMDGIDLIGFSDIDPKQLEDVQEGLKRCGYLKDQKISSIKIQSE